MTSAKVSIVSGQSPISQQMARPTAARASERAASEAPGDEAEHDRDRANHGAS